MGIDIDYLHKAYFVFDAPVPYDLKCGTTIYIEPVKLADSLLFMSSYGILDIDKNQSSDVEIIQMSYLQYLATKICVTPATQQQMINICLLCLGFKQPIFRYNDNGKIVLSNADLSTGQELFYLSAKEFDEIKKIILYQNLPKYDDSYIDPELKASMDEMDILKAKKISMPDLERRIGIISAHSGITKKEQLTMTLRSHTILFEEVVGEVEYSALKGVSCFGGKSGEVEWIYKKQKGKYDDYILSVEQYNKSMGGDGSIKSSTQYNSENLDSQYNEFMGG